nr:hypothetical protein CFP56_71613 [Quercus suber]
MGYQKKFDSRVFATAGYRHEHASSPAPTKPNPNSVKWELHNSTSRKSRCDEGVVVEETCSKPRKSKEPPGLLFEEIWISRNLIDMQQSPRD